ncbi:hypothetical protein DOY81_012832 [Sarcophaga bullata]|nr:hypothetical protein DOY81_012832 [Sarcophaga bullata]
MAYKNTTIDFTGCLADPQTQLSRALADHDIKVFRVALDMGAEATAMDDKHLSVYEKALQTYGCAEFVEECLRRDCNVNQINTHHNKAAINYAADSRDPQIIKAILRYPGVIVDRKYAQLTPLNSLAKNLTNENANDVAACMQLLLQYGASANIPDQREMTPLHYVVKNRKLDDLKKREIIEIFLQQPNLDIDTYRDGELRSLLKADYGDLNLPALRETNTVDFDTLLTYIRHGDMEKFKQQFPEYQLNISDKDNLRNTSREENLPLLLESIKRGGHEAFDLLMRNEVDYNAVLMAIRFRSATVCGNWYALQELVKKPDLKIRREDQPLIAAIRRLKEEPLQDKSTPLHYAVKHRNSEAIRELLKRGAYIGIKSDFNELPIDGMNPDLLEEHFDSCLTTNNAKVGDNSYEILINYKNFMPHNSAVQKKSAYQLREEMPPITFLAKSRDYRHLLQHPVITSFLFLKWHRLSVIFYLNFILYLFFAVSIITHTMLRFRESEYENLAALFGLFSWIGICYMILRECLQFIMSPVNYFRSLINYMELALIVLSIMTCIQHNYDKETQRNIAVCTFILIAVELCFLVGSLPVSSISTHMLMLDAEPLGALAKTIVMLTGEFDAGDLQFDTLFRSSRTKWHYCACNLLARYEEVLTGRSERANFVVNHEPFRSICRRLMNLYPNYIVGRQIAILPNDNNRVLIPVINSYEMKELENNKDSFIPLPNHDSEKQQKLLDPPVQFLPCCCSFITNKCSEMDKRTVKLAMAIIDRKSDNIEVQTRVQSTEKRLENIEEKLEKLFELLQAR